MCIFTNNASDMRPTKTLLLLLVIGLLVSGCDTTDPAEPAPEETVRMRASDDAVELMRARLNQATEVMIDVLRDPAAVTSLYEAVALRDAEGFDENVSFAHMLVNDPDVSKAYVDVRDPFATAFDRALEQVEPTTDKALSGEDLRTFLIRTGTIIRIPYHDRFDASLESPTVVAHPLTPEAEKASPELTVDGFRPVAGKTTGYETVPVNRALAKTEPVLVVAPCDRIYIESALETAKSATAEPNYCGGYGGGPPGGSEPPAGDEITADDDFEVYLDWMQCRKDTDSIFSGGPDYQVFIYEPDITTYPIDPRNDTYDGFFQVDQFSGKDCDKKRWERVGTVWDSKWEKIDEENGFLVYDWDRIDDTSITYNVGYDGTIAGVDVDARAQGTFRISNNAPLFNIKINRDAFIANNNTDCRNLGMRDGNCIRGGGSSIRFTLGANLIE